MVEFYYDDGTPVNLADHQFNTNPENFQDSPIDEDIFEEIENGTFLGKFVEITDEGEQLCQKK